MMGRKELLNLHRDTGGLTVVEWMLLAALVVIPAIIVILALVNSQANRLAEGKEKIEDASKKLGESANGIGN
jgi:hypothetical protein